MDLNKIESFIRKQKVAFICSVDGYYCDLKTESFTIE